MLTGSHTHLLRMGIPRVSLHPMCFTPPFTSASQQSPKLNSLILYEWRPPVNLVLPREPCAQAQYAHKYTHEARFHRQIPINFFAGNVCILYECACIVKLEDHFRCYSSGCHPSNLLIETVFTSLAEFTGSVRLIDSKPGRSHSPSSFPALERKSHITTHLSHSRHLTDPAIPQPQLRVLQVAVLGSPQSDLAPP